MVDRSSKPKRLAIVANDLPPYREPIYRSLADRFDTLVLLGKEELNRKWASETSHSQLRIKRSRGLMLKKEVTSDDGTTVDVSYLQLNFGLIPDLIRFRPELIISGEMGFRSLVSLGYGAVTRKPVWIWWGGTAHTERNRSKLRIAYRRYVFAKIVRHWISYGKSATRYLQSIGVDPATVVELQNSANTDVFDGNIPPPHPLEGPNPKVLFVGQMIGRKGIFELLDAASAVQSSGHEFSLILVGDGPESEAVDERIHALGLKHVQRFPYVAPADLPPFYSASDAFIFPTLEDFWGLVVNEALHCNVPVLVSCYAGCAEELAEDDCIFDPLDPMEFRSVLERCVRDGLPPPRADRLWPAGAVPDKIAASLLEQMS